MTEVTFRVSGLASLEAQLTELGAELGQKTLAAAARLAMKPVIDAAKAMVPRDTGELADSLKLRVVKPRGGDAVVVVGIAIGRGTGAAQARIAAAAFGEGQSRSRPAARRWHLIEFGTVKMSAHPFLRPALDQNAAATLELLKAELVKGIERAVKRKSRGAR